MKYPCFPYSDSSGSLSKMQKTCFVFKFLFRNDWNIALKTYTVLLNHYGSPLWFCFNNCLFFLSLSLSAVFELMQKG